VDMLYYELGDIVTLKKPHAWGENEWEITRLGIDMKLKCLNCQRVVWISRIDFEKRVRKIKEDGKYISIVHHKKKEE